MKLWRLSYHDDNAPSGNVTEWFTAQVAARRRAAELRRLYRTRTDTGFFIHSAGPRLVDVPTTRAALAAFLTSYDP